MDTNSPENAFNSNDLEATYRALRDSILQIYQFGIKIAKEANPNNELQVSWELGDTSLMNWISDTHCYLSRKGQKLQFLARPSKLEIITFNLNEGDKLLICSDSLRQNLSDNEIDEILQESEGSESSCQNLLKMAKVNNGITENTHNVVVMEVINNQTVITPTPIIENKIVSKASSKLNPLWVILPLLLLTLGVVSFWLWENSGTVFGKSLGVDNGTIALDDTLKFINNDSLKIAKANDTITKEFESEKKEMSSPKQKDNFVEAPIEQLKTENKSSITNERKSNNSFGESKSVKKKSSVKESVSDSDNNGNSYSKISSINPAREENYTALLQQRERWITIKNDLQNTLNSGNSAAAEKLENSKRVLDRIEKKIRESEKKVGKN